MGRGSGSPRRQGGGASVSLLKIPGGCLRRIGELFFWGGGGAFFFFCSGPKRPPRLGIPYTCTDVKHYEHHRCESDTHTLPLSQKYFL